MEQTTFRQTEGRRFSCPRCGGGLRYDIASGQMKCDHCESMIAVSALPAETSADTTMEVTEFRCPQCGAAVYSSDTAVTSFCSFCGSDVVLTAKLTRTHRPARIVPFTVTREDCERHYREHLQRHRLVPAALRSAETVSHFRAVYVPFWSYHVRGQGPLHLKATKSYTKGNTRYDETYRLNIDAVIDQKGVLYDASTAFEDETAALLRHTADQAVPFHAAYLSGFFAQGADVRPETYYPEAAATAMRQFLDQVEEKTDMDSVTVSEDAAHAFGLPDPSFSQELIMLPVWLLAHRENDRVVYTAVNGCTGEVVCDLPVSMPRAAAVAAGLAAAIFALLTLSLTLKPEALMALCAVISVFTQYRFSAMHKRLYDRRQRTYEPDFSGEGRTYQGPAQMLLNKEHPSDSAKSKIRKLSEASISVLVILVIAVASGIFEGIVDSLSTVSGSQVKSLLAPIVLIIAFVVMLVHTVRAGFKASGGPALPRIISCAACGAGLLCLLFRQYEDALYYACAVAMLASSVWELVLISRAHNEYASRPVPYFDGKEGSL